MDPGLVDIWRGHLSALVEHGSYAEVRGLALDITEQVRRSPEKSRWRRLDRTARKVIDAANEIPNPPPPEPTGPDENWIIARDEARLARVESELVELEADLRLADSVQAAALRLLGNPEITLERGRDGLAGWQLRVLQAGGRAPLRWGTQRA